MQHCIELRFWDEVRKKWTWIIAEKTESKDYPHPIMVLDGVDVHEKITISQCIDEYDIDGKKIFVGDWVKKVGIDQGEIFRIINNGEQYQVRRYMIDYRCQCDGCTSGNYPCWTYEDLPLFYGTGNVKVIGNLFEDPELYRTYHQKRKHNEKV